MREQIVGYVSFAATMLVFYLAISLRLIREAPLRRQARANAITFKTDVEAKKVILGLSVPFNQNMNLVVRAGFIELSAGIAPVRAFGLVYYFSARRSEIRVERAHRDYEQTRSPRRMESLCRCWRDSDRATPEGLALNRGPRVSECGGLIMRIDPKGWRVWRARLAVVMAVVCLTSGCVSAVQAAGSVPSDVRVLSGGQYGFADPRGVASGGGHVWIANSDGNSVTELSADGSWVRTLSGQRYGFRDPYGIVADGADIWVLNAPPRLASSLTEVDAATGRWIRTLSGTRLANASDIVADGPRLWVLSSTEWDVNSLVELRASDGRWIRTVPEPSGFGVSSPAGLAVAGRNLWIANTGGTGTGSLTELEASDGKLVRIVSGARYRLVGVLAIAADAGDVWVTSESKDINSGWVTEVDSASGDLVRIVAGGRYGFNTPAAIAGDGAHLWVANSYAMESGGSVTEFSAAGGRWIRTVAGDDFTNPGAIGVYDGRVWVCNHASVTVVTIQ